MDPMQTANDGDMSDFDPISTYQNWELTSSLPMPPGSFDDFIMTTAYDASWSPYNSRTELSRTEPSRTELTPPVSDESSSPCVLMNNTFNFEGGESGCAMQGSLSSSSHSLRFTGLSPPTTPDYGRNSDFEVGRMPPDPIAPSALICPYQCRAHKTFGRPYELNRHIKEQHRCPHKDCKSIVLKSKKEKDQHEKTHSEIGLVYRCGNCERNGERSKGLKRFEKLRSHFKSFHESEDEPRQCKKEGCFHGEECGGLFFTSQEWLEEHYQRQHLQNAAQSCRPSFPSDHGLNGTPLLSTVGTVGNIGKRSLGRGSEPGAKRGKVMPNTIGFNKQPQAIGTSSYTSYSANIAAVPTQHAGRPTQAQISEIVKSVQPHPSVSVTTDAGLATPAEHLEETLTLSVIALQSLTKQSEFQDVIEELKSLRISPSFDSRNAAIKLRGTCSADEMESGKAKLQALIEKSAASFPQRKVVRGVQAQFKAGADLYQQPYVHPQSKTLPLNAAVDSDILRTWHECILPKLPGIVEKTSVGDTHSAALVRQSGANGDFPVIRFGSPGGQDRVSRDIIREEIARICRQTNTPHLDVQFSKSCLVRLAGGNSNPSILDDPSNDQMPFPHQRRYRRNAGPGDSIGMSTCDHVSATLGGYVEVDGVKYMLSVDHFIYPRFICDCDGVNELSSPSPYDRQYVRRLVEQKLYEIEIRIRHEHPEEIPLDRAADLLFQGDVNEELEQYNRFLRELNLPEREYTFGKLRERCDQQCEYSTDSEAHVIPHILDWSLWEVTNHGRMGKNVHRHGRNPNPQISDLSNELTQRDGGSGAPCEDTRDVKHNELVFYVGQASGLRQGRVHHALVQIKENGVTYHEWAMIDTSGEGFDQRACEGDSGAWIMSDDDNTLLGMVYGWQHRLLLFTPIQYIFADIKRRMGCHIIKLPKHSPRPLGPRARRMCSIHPTAFPPLERSLGLPQKIAVPRRRIGRLEARERSTSRKRHAARSLSRTASNTPSSSASSTRAQRSPSPAPSLVSWASTLSDEPCPDRPAPQFHMNLAFRGKPESEQPKSMTSDTEGWELISANETIAQAP